MKLEIVRCILGWCVAGPDSRLENLETRQIEFVQQKAPSHVGEEGGRWMKIGSVRRRGPFMLRRTADHVRYGTIEAPCLARMVPGGSLTFVCSSAAQPTISCNVGSSALQHGYTDITNSAAVAADDNPRHRPLAVRVPSAMHTARPPSTLLHIAIITEGAGSGR